jgi:predicted Zn-dependent peptidase
MAHILEHMFFKGSQKRPGGTAISRAANDIGARMNAYTAYDHTVYYISAMNSEFETAFDILADMYLNPLFPEDEFKKELNPILSELREREDDPEDFLFEESMQQYLGKAYHPIIGTKKSIKGASVKKMHDFKNKFYGGDNVLIAVVGGIDKDTLIRVLSSHLKSNPATEKPEMETCSYTPGELELKKPGIQEAYYNLLYPALPPLHPDRFKQDVMSYLLGGSDSGLLFERIREELGMSCYGIYTFGMRHLPFSMIGISTGIEPKELDQLHNEVTDQIKRITDSVLDDHQLKRAKASIRSSIAAKSETSNGLAGLVSLAVMRGESGNPIERALNELNEITLEDVLDQAQKTFSVRPFKGVLLPK